MLDPMTFEQWKATAQDVENLNEAIPGADTERDDAGIVLDGIDLHTPKGYGYWIARSKDPETGVPMWWAPCGNAEVWTADRDEAIQLLWDCWAKYDYNLPD